MCILRRKVKCERVEIDADTGHEDRVDRSYLSIYSYDLISDCGYGIIYSSMYDAC